MKITLKNFKQHKSKEIQISNHTILYGANGTGKTSFLEALDLFFSNTHQIFRELILNEKDDKQIKSLFNSYTLNQAYLHNRQNFKTFSKNKGNFSIKFTYVLDDKDLYLQKKYKSSGKVDIETNIDRPKEIVEFFRYQFFFYKKEYNAGPLSKGEYAIHYILKFTDLIKSEIKNMRKISLDPKKYLISGFDEPDNKIHPVYWKEVYGEILKLNNNVIISTTSIFTLENFLDFKTNKIYFFNKEYLEKENILETHIKEIPLVMNNGKNYIDFDYGNLKSILPVKKYIIVEGKSDLEFFNILLRDMKYQNFEIISIDGQDESLSAQKLKPMLSFIASIQSFSPHIYCIFDYDKDGFNYAKAFESVLSENNILFVNGERYFKGLEWVNSNPKFTLENLLWKKHIKEKEYVSLNNEDIIKLLKKRLENYKCNDFKFNDDESKLKLTKEFEQFLKNYLESQKNLINVVKVKKINKKSSPLFTQDEGKRTLNYKNYNKKNITNLKDMISKLLGDNFTPYKVEIEERSYEDIERLKEIKDILKIPDYLLKINNKTISFVSDYNYYYFNKRAEEGVISNEINDLIKILNSDSSKVSRTESKIEITNSLKTKFNPVTLKIVGYSEEIKVNNHKALYVEFCKVLYTINSSKMLSCINNVTFNGIKNKYFANSEKEIHVSPEKIAPNLFIETRFNQEKIYSNIIKLMGLYGISNDNIIIKGMI